MRAIVEVKDSTPWVTIRRCHSPPYHGRTVMRSTPDPIVQQVRRDCEARRVRKMRLRLFSAFSTLGTGSVFAGNLAPRHDPCTTKRHALLSARARGLTAARPHLVASPSRP